LCRETQKRSFTALRFCSPVVFYTLLCSLTLFAGCFRNQANPPAIAAAQLIAMPDARWTAVDQPITLSLFASDAAPNQASNRAYVDLTPTTRRFQPRVLVTNGSQTDATIIVDFGGHQVATMAVVSARTSYVHSVVSNPLVHAAHLSLSFAFGHGLRGPARL
jgi:hypothetical protein